MLLRVETIDSPASPTHDAASHVSSKRARQVLILNARLIRVGYKELYIYI